MGPFKHLAGDGRESAATAAQRALRETRRDEARLCITPLTRMATDRLMPIHTPPSGNPGQRKVAYR